MKGVLLACALTDALWDCAYADYCAWLQAACRADLYANKPLPENSNVPVSQEGQMSALRQAFRTADEEERERRYEAFLSESMIDAE